jgi:hypothetical protein
MSERACVRGRVARQRQWTATTLYPFPGFELDYPYRDQSAPSFGTTKVWCGNENATQLGSPLKLT